MQKFLYLVLLVPIIAKSQHTLTVKATNIKNSQGYIGVAVYNGKDGFLKTGKEFSGAFEKTIKGTTVIKIPDLPDGTYAVSIFHDQNGNKKLDTNILGIPKEPVAFSNAKMKTFGPPDFKDCAFKITSDLEMEISFE